MTWPPTEAGTISPTTANATISPIGRKKELSLNNPLHNTAFARAADRAHHNRGMTLVELLTVISIIIILMGMVLGAALGLMGKGRHKNAEGLLQNLAHGLESYQREHDMFLPDDDDNSSRPLWYALEYDGQFAEPLADNRLPDGTFTDELTGKTVTHFIYIDAWKIEIRYTCSKPWNTYELRSSGPDLVFDSPDDIYWPK
jgi:type II secretory pathway pseudopilin PulG